MTDTMTPQEAYDYRRKARYARERKATEDALRPRMVVSSREAIMRSGEATVRRMKEIGDKLLLAELMRRAATRDHIEWLKDVTDGAIVQGHDD